MKEFHPEDYLSAKTLILGEINTGKTTLTWRVLEAFCRMGFGGRIAVLDMAPEMNYADKNGLAGIGGKLAQPEGRGVLYLGGLFEPPRLSSKTAEEAMEKARRNMVLIDGLLRQLDCEPRDILFINDASMYLQAGKAKDIVERLDLSSTAVVNGYWGERLGGGKLSERERIEMSKLKSFFLEKGRLIFCS